MANNNSGKNEKDLVCSFCGKHQDEVERMIIGPGVNICSECIGLCHDLLCLCICTLYQITFIQKLCCLLLYLTADLLCFCVGFC